MSQKLFANGSGIVYTTGYACDSFRTVSGADVKKIKSQDICTMYNVFVFSGSKMICCVGLNYVVDVVSVSDDGT